MVAELAVRLYHELMTDKKTLRQIMDLVEAGIPKRKIAKLFRLSPNELHQIIKYGRAR